MAGLNTGSNILRGIKPVLQTVDYLHDQITLTSSQIPSLTHFLRSFHQQLSKPSYSFLRPKDMSHRTPLIHISAKNPQLPSKVIHQNTRWKTQNSKENAPPCP